MQKFLGIIIITILWFPQPLDLLRMTTGKVQDFITGNGPPFGESSFVTVVNSLPNDHRQHFDGIFIGHNARAQKEGVTHNQKTQDMKTQNKTSCLVLTFQSVYG